MTTLPLDGVRVVDLADEPGVFAARILADLGADVVRVEPPDGGRVRRRPPFLDAVAAPESSLYHQYLNANKRSVVADITTPDGAALTAGLAGSADIVIETGSPGALGGRGLGYEELAARNPGIVYVSVSPFGQRGPWAARLTSDLVAAAAGGLLWVTGHPDDPPTLGGGDQSFKMASLVAVTGAMAALTGRDADPDGHGFHVDVSIQEAVAMAVVQTSNPNHYAWHKRVPQRPGLTAVHRCADGRYVAVYPSRQGIRELLDLAKKVGADVTETARSLDQTTDLAARTHGIFRAVATAMPRDEFLRECFARDIWCLPVQSLPDMAECDHFQATGQFRDVASESIGRALSFARSPVDCLGPDLPIRAAPLLGEHTAHVMADWSVANGGRTPGPAGVSSTASPDGSRPRPLEGIRVLDFCWVLAGPLGTRILANLGAEVIRVAPSPDRTLQDFYAEGVTHPDTGAFHNLLDTGKKSVSIDPRTPRGRDLLLDLAAQCDVVCDNYRPGAIEKMGFGYEALRERRHDIVALHLPGCGSSGPWSTRPTLGNMVVAASGLNYLTGFPGRSPRGLGVAYPDFTSPYLLATSVLAALRRRRLTGQGSELDLGQLSATVSLVGVEWMAYRATGAEPAPRQNRDPAWCPHGVYPADAPDEWIAIAVETDEQFAALCEVLDLAAVARDARFASYHDRKRHEDDLDGILWGATAAWGRYDLADRLQDAGVPASPVQHLRDVLERDPHLAEHYLRVRQPVEPDVEIVVQREAVRFAGCDYVLRPSPAVGADTGYVLLELLGLDGDEVAELYESGVVLQ